MTAKQRGIMEFIQKRFYRGSVETMLVEGGVRVIDRRGDSMVLTMDHKGNIKKQRHRRSTLFCRKEKMMIQTIIVNEDGETRSLQSDIAINISLTKVNEEMCGVEAVVSGNMNGIQMITAFADVTEKIIKSISEETKIPEPVARQIFMMQFSGRRNNGTTT